MVAADGVHGQRRQRWGAAHGLFALGHHVAASMALGRLVTGAVEGALEFAGEGVVFVATTALDAPRHDLGEDIAGVSGRKA